MDTFLVYVEESGHMLNYAVNIQPRPDIGLMMKLLRDTTNTSLGIKYYGSL